jgi:KDO2-lipid IV(A) lauroyltransferase
MMIRTIALLLSRVPLVLLHGMGFMLGWLAWMASPSYRRLFRAMLRQAIGEDHPRYHAILHKAVGETGKGLMELPYVWFREGRSSAAHKVVCDDWGVVEPLLEQGRGIIFLTPHLGCFEVAAQAFAQRAPITVLYRPNRNADMQTLIETRRQRENVALAPTDLGGVRSLLKALKRGQAIGILPDQVPSNGEGVWVNAWGRPAYTMNLPAKFHVQTGAVPVLAVAVRLPWGRGWRMKFEPLGVELPADTTQATELINREIEKLVLRYPEQYYWAYNRYKVPEGASPMSQADKAGSQPKGGVQ